MVRLRRCRICAELKTLDKLIDLRLDLEKHDVITEKMERLNQRIEFLFTRLPSTVCLECIDSLDKAYDFVVNLERSRSTLNNLFIDDEESEIESSDLEDKLGSGVEAHNPPANDEAELAYESFQQPSPGLASQPEHNITPVSPQAPPTAEVSTPAPTVTPSEDVSPPAPTVTPSESEGEPSYTTGTNIESSKVNPKKFIIRSKGKSKQMLEIECLNKTEENNGSTTNEKNSSQELINASQSLVVQQNGTEVVPTSQDKVVPGKVVNVIIVSKLTNQQLDNDNDNVNIYSKKNRRTRAPNLEVGEVNPEEPVPSSENQETWVHNSWECKFCKALFSTIDKLCEHSLAEHKSCNPYRCTQCKIHKGHLDRFLQHVNTHKPHLSFSCYKCFKRFKTVELTQDHVKRAHFETAFICPGCHAFFINNKDLKQHEDMYLKTRMKTTPPDDYNKTSLTCKQCQKVCRTNALLKSHLLSHSKQMCQICGKCVVNLSIHIQSQHTDIHSYKCNICKMTFNTSSKFSKHKKVHQVEQWYCDHCGKRCKTRRTLKDHLALHTAGGNAARRVHPCHSCDLSFKSRYELNEHVSVHENALPFSCDQCTKCFRLKRNLVGHLTTHDDARPFKCTECEKAFRQNCLLKIHMRKHTGETPYSCDVCKRAFANWSNMNKHKNIKHR